MPWPSAVALAPQAAGTRGSGGKAEAERLAAGALQAAATDPAAALLAARRALAMTAEFVPTDYVTAGRKGEVVEDEFQAARDGYRQHRALLYEAVGTALARQGQPLPASRFQRRAFLLDPTPDRGLALARSLNDLGRGREALDTVQRAIAGLTGLKPESTEVIARAADVAGLPSAQAEIDRGRLAATLGKAVELREGPLELPPGVRLSTAPAFRVEEAAITAIYAAEASCRSCSADLDVAGPAAAEGRADPRPAPGGRPGPGAAAGARPLPAPLAAPARAGPGRADAPSPAIAAARGARRVDAGGAEGALRAGARARPSPRSSAWTCRRRCRGGPGTGGPSTARRSRRRPACFAEGLAPGEDEPSPPEFTAAVEAYRGGRAAEAQKGFDALEARGDGWLLPPEARLNRALCLARRRAEGRGPADPAPHRRQPLRGRDRPAARGGGGRGALRLAFARPLG